jgi:hypothetical protein
VDVAMGQYPKIAIPCLLDFLTTFDTEAQHGQSLVRVQLLIKWTS